LSLRTGRILVFLLLSFVAFTAGRLSNSWQVTDLFSSSAEAEKQTSDLLQKIRAKNVLEVVMVNGPTTYFEGAMGREGLNIY